MDVNIINKKELNEFELTVVEDYSGKFYDRLAIEYYKTSQNVRPKLFLAVKKHAKKPSDSMVCNYSIHAKLEAPSIIISAHESDWDLKKALNKTFDNMVREMQHKFKDISARAKRAKKLKR